MLAHILNIIAPVFLVIIAGFFSIRQGVLADSMVDGLMKFAIQIAVHCLLFRASSTLDLGTAYDWGLMLSFYGAAAFSFSAASLVAYFVFKRHPGESVATGFGALFSNSVLLGLPISERAWGAENLSTAYAIISIHAPFCYLLGITTMEIVRSDGRSWPQIMVVVSRAMFRNSLMIGIGLALAHSGVEALKLLRRYRRHCSGLVAYSRDTSFRIHWGKWARFHFSHSWSTPV